MYKECRTRTTLLLRVNFEVTNLKPFHGLLFSPGCAGLSSGFTEAVGENAVFSMKCSKGGLIEGFATRAREHVGFRLNGIWYIFA